MYDQYINHFEDALDPIFCDQVVDFFNSYLEKKIETNYGTGENTSSKKILLDSLSESDKGNYHIKDYIYSTIRKFIIESIN